MSKTDYGVDYAECVAHNVREEYRRLKERIAGLEAKLARTRALLRERKCQCVLCTTDSALKDTLSVGGKETGSAN